MQSTWTDASNKGVLAMVPAMVVLPDGPLWRQNWPLGTHVNDGINILRGPAGMGIEFWWQSTVLMARAPRPNVATTKLSHLMRGGLANVLAKIAGFVCELAHDYYEDADAPIASDLADAAKIKSMKAPDGSYVFPRAEDVGRDFALELLSMDSVRFA